VVGGSTVVGVFNNHPEAKNHRIPVEICRKQFERKLTIGVVENQNVTPEALKTST
jgi:hypothetical protein